MSRVCAGCGDEATMQCPKCLKLGLESTYFCDQVCFKKNWKKHNTTHKLKMAIKNYQPPDFGYTGPLRPHYVSPMRDVPSHIEKPDYWATGQPLSEMQARRRGKHDIPVYNENEIEIMREAGRIGRELLDLAGNTVEIGVTTEYIDQVVHERCIELDAYPSPLNYHGFPKSCCTSVNEVICHGIPDARPLENGDIVNVDISIYYKGFHSDLNETFLVGDVDEDSKLLVKAAHDCLQEAIASVESGVLFRSFGKIITKSVKEHGFSVVRTYCGHGVGRDFHCNPNVPHYAKNKAVGVVRPGMVFTIEPMINAGDWQDLTWPDDWTAVTIDGKRSAQFEHTLLVTEDGVELLTARTENSVPFWWEDENQNEVKED